MLEYSIELTQEVYYARRQGARASSGNILAAVGKPHAGNRQ